MRLDTILVKRSAGEDPSQGAEHVRFIDKDEVRSLICISTLRKYV